MPDINPVVVATYSRRMRLRLGNGAEVDARIKGKQLQPVCGDRVMAAPIEQEADWLITDICQRSNELGRTGMRGKTEVLAANLDLLLVVAAASPAPDWFVVDRYLSAAADMRADAAIIYNKTDLDADPAAATALDAYRNAGYATVSCSAVREDGIDEVAALLTGSTAIVVGQSGVGKSSIINRLTASTRLPTAAISKKRGEGRHTTVNSVMIDLPDGGWIIDSPGVRDYAPALQSADRVAHGFREIAAAAQDCRFANCRHTREPDCAVKRGVDTGTITVRRYESYKRLLHATEKLSKT